VTVKRQTKAPPSDASDRLFEGVAFLASATLLIAVPLLWDSRALDMFRGPKSDLALAAWVVMAAIFVVRNPRGTAWRDPWWLAWGGVVAGGLVSALLCAQPGRALVALLPLALAAVGWGAVRQLSEPRRRTLAALVVWAGVIEAVLVLVFLRTAWKPETFALLGRGHGRYAWIGSFGNPADVAVFLALPALLAAARAVASRRLRLTNGAAAGFMIAVILGTRTLTSVLALFAGAIVLIWMAAPRTRRLALVTAILAIGLVLFLATPLAQKVRDAVRETEAGGLLWLGSARFAAYAAAASMVGSRPATGVGFGLYEANSYRFQSLDALAERGRVLGLETGFGEAHNDVLQYAAETGLVGLALAGAGLAWALRRRPREAGGVVPVWPLVAAAAALAITQFPLHLAAVAAQWTVLGALALPALPPRPRVGVWGSRVGVLVAGVLVGAALVLVWQHSRTNALFQQARVLSATLRASSEPPQRRAEIARVALANLAPRLTRVPYSWNAALILGNLAIDAGDTSLALASFERALALGERPEVEFDVGIALTLAGSRETGMAHLVRAVELNPAIFRQVRDRDLARALRQRLDASGYGAKHAWMYVGTPAANP
jgi:tetratricopeptide (TPR) repeat protein